MPWLVMKRCLQLGWELRARNFSVAHCRLGLSPVLNVLLESGFYLEVDYRCGIWLRTVQRSNSAHNSDISGNTQLAGLLCHRLGRFWWLESC